MFGKIVRSLRCPTCGHERWIASSTAIVPWLGLTVGAASVLARRTGPVAYPGWTTAGVIVGCIVLAVISLMATDWALTWLWRRRGRCPTCGIEMVRGTSGFACFGLVPGVHDMAAGLLFIVLIAAAWLAIR